MGRKLVYGISTVAHVALLLALGTVQEPLAEAALQTVELVAVAVPAPEPEPEPVSKQEPAPAPEPEPEPEPEPAPEPKPEPKPAAKPTSKPQAKAAAPSKPASQVPAVPVAAGGGSADAPVIDVPEYSGEPAPAKPAGPSGDAQPPRAGDGDSEAKDSGGCDEPLVKAEPIDVPEPGFTAEATAEGIAGKVRLTLKIDAEGKVTSAKVSEGLGYGLDEAAIAAAKSARFKPATRCGQPVASTFKLAIKFTP